MSPPDSAPAAAAPEIAEVPIAALHASSIRAMTEFVRNPTPSIARTVLRLLDALGRHPDRFTTPCGHDVYAQASAIWRDVAVAAGVATEASEASEAAPRVLH